MFLKGNAIGVQNIPYGNDSKGNLNVGSTAIYFQDFCHSNSAT